MDSSRDQDHHQRRSNSRRGKNPSFSSTLLDAIYRSIDESNGTKGGTVDEEELIYYKETLRKKQQQQKHSINGLMMTRSERSEERDSNMRRACMIEKWIEKKVSFENNVVNIVQMESTSPAGAVLQNSSSSSSESSCGGGFSSSESDSMYGSKSRSSSFYSMQKPKPIRTSISSSAAAERKNVCVSLTQKQQQLKSSEGGFVKTKSKASKIYSDLKKVKQPISPGGRLASFLNSLFSTAGNAKKAKILKPKPESESTCSSASSFSRSCLSKTPSSRGKLSNGAKRSVRFCPVSVIVDEDCRPCGQKNLYENEQKAAAAYHINEELQYHVMSESRRVEEAARELLKNYQKIKKEEFDQMRGICVNDNGVSYDDIEDDDAASYASSDLFELDNLSAIGIERYREELPVYETTHLGTNRAIASGLIL